MDDTTAEIKQAVDIVDVIGGYVRLEAAGNQFRGLCPFHQDHKPSMMVNPQFQNYRCWACDARGDVFRFVQEIEKITFVEAKERLAERAGITLHRGRSDRADPKQLLYGVLNWAYQEFQNCLKDDAVGGEARQYLSDRGLTSETVREHGLGYAPPQFEWLVHRAKRAGYDSELLIRAGLARTGNRQTPYDVFRGRVMFPIRDERGRVLSFGGRILPSLTSDDTAKYLNTAATDVYNKSEVLYGLDVVAADYAKRSPAEKAAGRSLIVMEGYTDCLMAYQHGVRTAVATCGTSLTPNHVKKLARWADRAVLMFDGDEAGQKAARKSMGLFLSSELELRLCVLPDGLDPCDYLRRDGGKALLDRIEEAPDAFEFRMPGLRQAWTQPSLEIRQRALDGVLSDLANVPEMSGERSRMKYDVAIRRVSEATGVEELRVRRRIAEIRRDGVGNTPAPRPVEPVAESAAMNRRERDVVQWLVCYPGRAGEILPLITAEHLRHPSLRRLASAATDLYTECGESAQAEGLRERLDDPHLEDLLFELTSTAPTGESFENWIESLRSSLSIEQRRNALTEGLRGVAGNSDANDHLEMLKKANKTFAS